MSSIACIGSRKIEPQEAEFMFRIGAWLAKQGYDVYSGNAEGSDQAFGRGVNSVDPTRLFLCLPWHSYERDKIVPGNRVVPKQDIWWTEAAKYHPVWDKLPQGPRLLHARNVGIVKGRRQVIARPNPLKVGGGGTGMGLRLAEAYGIPVMDLTNQEHVARILSVMEK